MTRVQPILPWRCLVVAVLAIGCAPTVEYQYIGTEFLRNSQGHVVGHKETLLDARTGEEVEIEMRYTPVRDATTGEIIAYEEPVHGGTQIRGVDGRKRGLRYTDLRSRGSNPGNEGITITVNPK
jgi:hypothetical protein